MECKTCGSKKFKRISYHLYECEYCGNEYEGADAHRVDNPKYTLFSIGSIIYDPTKTLFSSPFYYDEENLQILK